MLVFYVVRSCRVTVSVVDVSGSDGVIVAGVDGVIRWYYYW